DRLDDARVVGEPGEIESATRVADRRPEARRGELVREVLHDGDRLRDEDAVVDQGWYLLVRVGVGGIGRASAVHPRDVRDPEDVGGAELLEEPDDAGRTRLRGVKERQHASPPGAESTAPGQFPNRFCHSPRGGWLRRSGRVTSLACA